MFFNLVFRLRDRVVLVRTLEPKGWELRRELRKLRGEDQFIIFFIIMKMSWVEHVVRSGT
jgi:hypothetical protein